MTQQNNGPDLRIAALRRFAVAISALTIVGHAYLGFEQAYAHVVVALVTGYTLELLLETLEAWGAGRKPHYTGGLVRFIDFLLPAHITGLACAMLLYANGLFWPIAFAVAVAVGSKYLLRTRVNGRPRHFLNPSNTGIALTLILFPWVGVAMPYMFTENTSGAVDVLIPLIFILAGSFLNTVLTKRLALILAWLGGFALQAVLRALLFDTPIAAGLLPMTGIAFLLFTFYMVTDPATTPAGTRGQVIFGASVAAAYALLMVLHVVFTLFFALFIVCIGRGLLLYARQYGQVRQAEAKHPALGGA